MNEVLTRFERKAPVGSDLPVLITPSMPGESLLDAQHRLRSDIESMVSTVGGVLLRGFDVPSVEDFRAFAAGFGHPLLSYDFGSTPRTEVGGGVYTTTEYPAHQSIPLHNEQAYTRMWPMKAWFHCVTPAAEGGETPIADSRAIYRRMPAAIRDRFAPGIIYVRNFGDFDVPWQKVFNTESRDEVEAFCRKAAIRWEWKPDGDLRTTQLCQAVETHPVTGELVWFNQAHLFHISNLQPEVRESLEELLGIENVPRNTYFADGSPIPDAMLDEVRAVLDAETVSFLWEKGDVTMLDNMLIAHARSPFKGPRKVVVAMAEPHDNLDKF
ncbi:MULTISPECIES: TauD/TfdA family dioxygenase [Betaproteobacteria]|uniref:TauD/TfdA family dioxygenase n=1 Tax=Acidovorax facilis TaxID=12917 RepID=A0ABV8D9B4_9BURK|nr:MULTISPECIES: TauD/TfdA family dioxygenase [Acidovorax]KQB59092.1 SyrP [Acidovorax sp. SD340]MBO1006810.1 TauD/TfdA family dioxygenase [Acidovorax sp. SD340]MCO4240317.1 TauD/TfdA family dioxygenase [Acidovorax facilis]